ncbi:MAG: response regulator transcription factor [Symploca sp. SIO2G7]|nr:response regulator transcription factor [Symploca sp. SIO2G7]
MLVYNKLTVDPNSLAVTYDGKVVRLHPKEYLLLELFLKYPNHVLSYDVIIDSLWDDDNIPTHGGVRAHIKGLRKALREADATEIIIETVHGLGYRLNPLNNNNSMLGAISPPVSVLKDFIKAKSIEYLIIDTNLIIKAISPGIFNYSDYPEMIKIGSPLQEGFPEFIGLEEALLKIINKESESFELDGIAKAANPDRPEYINFHVIADESKALNSTTEKLLFIFFEDASEKMIYRQKLVQRENEYYLLLTKAEENEV